MQVDESLLQEEELIENVPIIFKCNTNLKLITVYAVRLIEKEFLTIWTGNGLSEIAILNPAQLSWLRFNEPPAVQSPLHLQCATDKIGKLLGGKSVSVLL